MSSVYLHKLTQGRRKVCKSGRASSNVVGIIYPPLEKRQLICQNDVFEVWKYKGIIQNNICEMKIKTVDLYFSGGQFTVIWPIFFGQKHSFEALGKCQ